MASSPTSPTFFPNCNPTSVDHRISPPYIPIIVNHNLLGSSLQKPLASATGILLVSMTLLGCGGPEKQPKTPAESFERAVAAYQDGVLDRAREYFRQAELMSWQQGSRELQLQAMVYQTRIAFATGEVWTAIREAEEGAALARQIGDFRAEAEVRLLEGRSYQVAGIVLEAARAIEDALRIATTFQEEKKIIEAEIALGKLWMSSPDLTSASEHFSKALSAAQSMQDGPVSAQALNGLALVFLRQGKLQEASNSIGQAIAQVESSDSPELAATLRLTQGLVFVRLGNPNAALGTYRDAVNILRRARVGRRLEVLTLFRIGSLYASHHRGGDARKYFSDGLEIARREGDRIAQYYLNVHLLRTDIRLMTPGQRERIAPRIVQAYRQLAAQFSDILQKPGEAQVNGYAAEALQQNNPGAAIQFFSAASAAERLWEVHYLDPELHAPYVDELLLNEDDGKWSRRNASRLILGGAPYTALSVLEEDRIRRFSSGLDGAELALRHPKVARPALSLRNEMLDLRLGGVERSARAGLSRPSAGTDHESKSFFLKRDSLMARARQVNRVYPNYTLATGADSLSFDDIQQLIPRGITVVEHIGDGPVFHILAMTRSSVMVRTVSVPETTVHALAGEYLQLMLDPLVYRGEGGESSIPGMTRFATLSTQLYEMLLRPVESLFDRGILVIPSDMTGPLPLHALERQQGQSVLEFVIERMSVDYLPAWTALRFQTRPSARLKSIVAFGNPSGKNWSVDYELRDIRSFFRNAEVFTGRDASWENMKRMFPDLLQISSEFAPGLTPFGSLVVSEGSLTEETMKIPFEQLLMINPPTVILLTNQSGGGFALGTHHAILLRMNGTSDVFLNRWIADRKAAKFFSEFFFTHLSNGLAPGDAYRQALLNLIQTRENAHPRSWAQFFHFGTG